MSDNNIIIIRMYIQVKKDKFINKKDDITSNATKNSVYSL